MYRQQGIEYPSPGTDIPAWFLSDIKSIDKDIQIIFHPYEVIWDDFINEYTGPAEDPRFNIHWEGGYRIFGYPFRTNKDELKPDGRFHLWRHCWPVGWAHILALESTDEVYLKIALNRLYEQAWFRDKYGDVAWNKLNREQQEVIMTQMDKDRREKFGDIQEQNSWLMKKAIENFERGKINPTNPQKDSIVSYSGQKNRSRIIRPLTDEEGGLYTGN